MENTLLSIDETQKAIEGYEQTFTEFEVGDLKIDYTFDSKGGINCQTEIGSDSYNLEENSSVELLNRLGISSRVINEYGENYELLSSMIAYSKSKRANDKVRFVGVLGDVVAVETGGTPYISVQEAWEQLRGLPGLRGSQWVQNYSGSGFEFRLISDREFSPPQAVDDISESGMWARINGQAQVGSYVRRLVCSNGMMANKSLLEFTVKAGSRDELIEKFSDMSLTVWNKADNVADNFVKLADHKVTNPSNYLNAIMKEQKISNRYRAEIMDLLPTLPEDPTAYDIVNLVTAFGRRLDSLDHRSKFEWLGGRISELFSPEEHRCSHCSHVIDVYEG